MRILHTSDWHLGRSFHREDMLTHQAAYVDHLLEVVDRARVDLVVVAGDVYDRALPQVDAVRLADETLARLAGSRARVVLTSGNHDSAQRLGFSSRLIDAAGVFIRTDADTVGTPVLLGDEHGDVAVYGIPYLDPDAVREPWGLPARSHEAALDEAMRRVRADLGRRSSGTRSVVLAHASEADQRKGSWLVELGADGLSTAEFVEAPVPRPLARLRGTLAELLEDRRLKTHERAWVHATLTDAVRPLQAMEQLRARFPHTLVIAFEPVGARSPSVPLARPQGRSDHDIALDFVAELRGAPATDDESALLQAACDACCEDPEADVLVSAAGTEGLW